MSAPKDSKPLAPKLRRAVKQLEAVEQLEEEKARLEDVLRLSKPDDARDASRSSVVSKSPKG
jgi:hypothetical protein